MAKPDRLRLYSDDYQGVPPKLLRDINRMFAERDKELEDLGARVTSLEEAMALVLARLLAAGIP